MKNLQAIARADAGQWEQAMARTAAWLAPAVAATYVAGFELGRWLHQWNDELAAAVRTALAGPDPAVVARMAKAQLAAEITATLTVARLREITGITRRNARKAELVAALVEMAAS
jgi:hypothetical protein